MGENGAPALRLTEVSKRFGRVTALEGMSFDVAEGGFFALFGPSSVGKTTTLRAISGLEKIDNGAIEIGGVDMTDAPIRERGVAMVFQSFALYPHLTVTENLAYPLREEGLARAEIKQRVGEAAELLRLTHRLDNKPSTLSGGEQQRVALGRALIRRPRILLLDEPLTNLDAKLRHDMRAELKRLHRQYGMTIIYATPDELEALSMGDDIAVLENGRVVQQGSPDDLYERPQNIYVASKIGSPHMNLFDASVAKSRRKLETPLGPIPIQRKGLSPEEDIVLGIRPADIRLARKGEKHHVTTVKLVEPLGDLTVVSLAAADQTVKMLLSEADALDVAQGSDLRVVIAPERLHLFRKADGSAIAAAA